MRTGNARIAVAGAGILGLVAALRLTDRGHDVTVFERSSRVGGLAVSFFPVPNGDPLECFYHHIFTSDRAIIALIAELGLADRVRWQKPVTASFYGGDLERLDSASALLKFRKLTPIERVRLGVVLAILKAAPSADPFANLRAIPWLKRLAGENAYKVVFQQIFESKFGPYAEDVSLGWFWARIHDRTESLGYILGGFDALYEALAARVAERGGIVRTNAPMTAIAQSEGKLGVVSDGREDHFDRVLATMPLRRLATLTPALPRSFVDKHERTESLKARCLIIATDRRLTEAYWINISEPGYPFMVAVEHTNFIEPERYGGEHLIYLGNYGVDFPPRTADELLDEFAPFIRTLNPAFDRSWVKRSWLFEAADAQPIITPGYAHHIAPHRTPVTGLYVANLNQVYPHDRGQNYSVVLGESVADLIDADLRS